MELSAIKPALFDTECYPNYWMLGIRQNGRTFRFKKYEDENRGNFNGNLIKKIFKEFRTISFNGNGYDVAMIKGALCGYSVSKLKKLSDKLIVEGVKPWQLGLPDWEPSDHIDLMEVAPGQAGLKMYAARIHSKTIRDLPYDPNLPLTEEQILEVDEYNDIDLDDLQDLHDELQPQIKQREYLSKRYKVDLRSKSDAQLAETVLKLRCERAVGYKLTKQKFPSDFSFHYEKPNFIKFIGRELNVVLDKVLSCEFTLNDKGAVAMPPELDNLKITIGNSTYTFGIGGLHSNEKCVSHVADDNCHLIDADVASYYPNLILNSGKYPPSLGEQFAVEYKAIVDERLVHKANVKKFKEGTQEYEEAKVGDDGGKIQINGSFGKTGSPYSFLFAPTMLIQTTVTGQLSLLMLIEALELCKIPVVSANTDGIVVKCKHDDLDKFNKILRAWQSATTLQMETSEYKAIYSRDVNNYVAIKLNGSVKRKGNYAKSGLVQKKNPDSEICSDAIAEFLSKGVPIHKTIRQCCDLRKFITVQQVSGGGVKMWGHGPVKGILVKDIEPILVAHGLVKSGRQWIVDGKLMPARDAYESLFGKQKPEYLGKVVRWYYGTNSPGPIVYKKNGNTVGKSYGAKPCMTLPDEFPDDVDYGWYVDNATDMLLEAGYSLHWLNLYGRKVSCFGDRMIVGDE